MGSGFNTEFAKVGAQRTQSGGEGKVISSAAKAEEKAVAYVGPKGPTPKRTVSAGGGLAIRLAGLGFADSSL
jgi:hypothetical protein